MNCERIPEEQREMKRLNYNQIMEHNPHFNRSGFHVESTSQARVCDPWAFDRGYHKVVTVTDGHYKADYGFHTPTRTWHLWAN
jgi:hypothetical protein